MLLYVELESTIEGQRIAIGPFSGEAEARRAIDAAGARWEPARSVTGNGQVLMARQIAPRNKFLNLPVVAPGEFPHNVEEFHITRFNAL